MKTVYLLLVLLCMHAPLFSQIKFEGPAGSVMPAPLEQLYHFLKNAPTDTSLKNEELIPLKAPLYDQVIDRFFDTAAMSVAIARTKIQIQYIYWTLYATDIGVDRMPADSLFVMPADYYYQQYDKDLPDNHGENGTNYMVTLLVSGKHYPMLDIALTKENRFAYMAGFLYLNPDQKTVLDAFYKRHPWTAK